MQDKSIIQVINLLKSINYHDKFRLNDVTRKMYNYFKEYDVFKNIKWNEVIKYSLNANNIRSMKLGKIFKSSENSIYKYIVSGLCANDYNDYYHQTYCAQHGIMLLNVNKTFIYCYFKVDPGGCPTCGLDIEIGNPEEVILYMSNTIDELVIQCMSNSERERMLTFLVECNLSKYKFIKI